MSTWESGHAPPSIQLDGPGKRRAVWRFGALFLVLLPTLLALLLARAAEIVAHAGARRWSPRVVQAYCRFVLRVIGLHSDHQGRAPHGRGALVANHASWLDIFVLNAAIPVQFVAKAEVAGWPGIGLLARWAGTVFIRRDRRDAATQASVLAAELRRGNRLVFFPEGTSTDSTLMLPFKPTLFQALLAPDMPHDLAVQPVSLRYHAPPGADPRFYGWWGRMEFTRHFWGVLGQARQGRVSVTFHPPLPCATVPNRKVLAAASEAAVRAGFAAG